MSSGGKSAALEVPRMMAWLIQRNGAQRAAIQGHFGWTRNRTDDVCRWALKLGVVEKVKASPTVVLWLTPEAARSMRAKMDHVRSETSRLYQIQLRRERAAPKVEEVDEPMRRRYVKAGTLPPPVTTGARSVFEVA